MRRLIVVFVILFNAGCATMTNDPAQFERSMRMLEMSQRFLATPPPPQPMHIQCQNTGVYTNCTRW